MRCADADAAQARQVHGVLRNRVRHSSDRTHAALPLLSQRPREGAGEAVDAERAYRTHDQSGKLMPFCSYSYRSRALRRSFALFFIHHLFSRTDVYAYGRSGGRDRRYVLEARIDAGGNHRGQHAVQRSRTRCYHLVTYFIFTHGVGGRPLSPPCFTGEDDVRLRVHIRVPLTVRDGAAGAGTDGVRNRHTQHCRESTSIPEGR